MTKAGSVALTMALAALFVSPALADTKAKIGHWKLDFARSKLQRPPPKEDIRIYEDAGNGMVRSTHRVTRQDGTSFATVYTARDDGKTYPRYDGNGKQVGSITLTETGPQSQTYVAKAGDRVEAHGITTVSEDGNTLTMDQTNGSGPDARRDFLVWARQD